MCGLWNPCLEALLGKNLFFIEKNWGIFILKGLAKAERI